MQKRKIIIGNYDTALNGLWTLSGWELGVAEMDEEYVKVPGRNGLLDFSTVLTDGEPCYGNRSLVVVLESSEGNRLEREARIDEMMNELDGFKLNIILPDDPTRYLTGRVRVKKLYNDPAHCSVEVTATCEPWRYNLAETVVGLQASSAVQTVSIINNGRLAVVPTITVAGGSVLLNFEVDGGTVSEALSVGTYVLPDLYLRRGVKPLRYSGDGTALLTYREAVL